VSLFRSFQILSSLDLYLKPNFFQLIKSNKKKSDAMERKKKYRKYAKSNLFLLLELLSSHLINVLSPNLANRFLKHQFRLRIGIDEPGVELGGIANNQPESFRKIDCLRAKLVRHEFPVKHTVKCQHSMLVELGIE
jgi:hypothetical protein